MVYSRCALFGLVALFLPTVEGGPYIIADRRVRSLDITPVLGRGYSIMTNSFQSICLEVNEITVPSYNYDYEFHDISGTTIPDKLAGTFAYDWIKTEVEANEEAPTALIDKKNYVISTMRVERYYASVKEHKSPLVPDAVTLLNRQDYVGFFKSCGANYVRGIRRAQELTAVFSFVSSSEELAKEYSESLQSTRVAGTSTNGKDVTTKSKFTAVNESLSIKILGYGLGLTGSKGTLVATTLQEFNDIMKFAFSAMTQTEGDGIHIGMVYGIEVVPWVDNLSFQVTSNLLDEVIEIPLARSLIARAFLKTDNTDFNFVEANRGDYQCKALDYKIDKYGYCCESEALFRTDLDQYDDTDLTLSICRPVRELDVNLVKNNLATNGEFVARLDSTVRAKMNQFSMLEKCISATQAIPESLDFYVIKGRDSVKKDSTIPLEFTLYDIRQALDPFNDYGLVTYMGKELEEFLDMYITPCMSALFGMNAGSTSDTDETFFLANPWHTHPECTKMACLAGSMRWDRGTGECVPSLVAGSSAPSYVNTTSSDHKYCSFDPDASDDEQKCKYDTSALKEFADRSKTCWGNLPPGRVDFFLDYYCLPELSSTVLTSGDRFENITSAKASPCVTPSY